ncbi:MAG: helix-turn-helix domain-containing protein [Campylobacteraceae bacterium]
MRNIKFKKFFEKKEYQIILFVLAIFLIFTYINHSYNYKLLKDTIQAYENSVLSRIDGKLSDWIDERLNNIGKIKSYLEKSSIKNKDELQQELRNIQATSNFPYIILGLEDKDFLISEEYFVTSNDYDPTRRDWYKDTIEANKTIVTKPYVSMRLSLPAVSVCTPIHILSMQGVTCGGQPFETIQEYILEYEALYSKALYLVDSKGVILANSNYEKNSPPFLKIDDLSSDFLKIKVENTDWFLVFERDKDIYDYRLNQQFIISVLAFVASILLYLLFNFLWIQKNKKIKNELAEQTNHIFTFMQKHSDRGLILCDDSGNILFFNNVFTKLFSFKDDIKNKNFFNLLKDNDLLSKDTKEEIVKLIQNTKNNKESNFLTIQNDEEKHWLVTCSLLDKKLDTNYEFMLHIQELTEVAEQKSEDKEQKDNENDGNILNTHIEKILVFIDKNLDDEQLDVNKLSHISGYSKYHFQRIFKNYVGENIATYLRKLRLEKSAFFLKYSEEKITEIAARFGFYYNQSYTRSFEKFYLKSPVNFRDDSIKLVNSSSRLKDSEYEIVEFEEKQVAYVYKSLNKDLYETLDKLKTAEVFDDITDTELLYVYGNDPSLLIDRQNSLKPYILGVLVNNSNKNIQSLPVLKIQNGKYAKIVFDETKYSFEEFIQRVCITFYNPNINKEIIQIFQILSTNLQKTKEQNLKKQFYIKIL